MQKFPYKSVLVAVLLICLLSASANGSELTRNIAEIQIKKVMSNVVRTANLKEGKFQLYGFGWENYETLARMGFIRTNVLDYCFYQTRFSERFRKYVIEASEPRTFANGLGHTVDQNYTDNKVLLWRVKYDKVTGIKKERGSFSGCGARVDFTCKVEKTSIATAVAGGGQIPGDYVSLSACFSEYDDGWRLESLALPDWVGRQDGSMKAFDENVRKKKINLRDDRATVDDFNHKGHAVKVLNSGGYTYVMYLENKNTGWVAAMETRVKPGDMIEFNDSPPMVNFQSKSLGLTFDQIMFAPNITVKRGSQNSTPQNYSQKNIDEILKLIDSTFKAKVQRTCGTSNDCVAVISDGKVMRASSVTEAINIASSGDIVLLGAADYYETLRISNRKNLVIIGNNSGIVTEKDEGIINLENCSNITLYGLHVVHRTGSSCTNNCISMSKCDDIKIINNDIDGSGYFGIESIDSTHIKVHNNKIHNCTYGTIANSEHNSIELTKNTFYDNKEGNFDPGDEPVFQANFEAHNDFGKTKSEELGENPDAASSEDAETSEEYNEEPPREASTE